MPRLETSKSPTPTDKHVGKRVRMRRMMLSMSQTSLASALGLTFQQVQKYEKGANRIGASRLQQIRFRLSGYHRRPSPDQSVHAY
jgi:DNA-binding transcriptional regulator YiaG